MSWKLSRTVLRGGIGGNADLLLGIKAEDGKKQPYLLRPKDQKPLLLAGMTNVTVEADSGMRSPEAGALVDGVVIVTDASDQGMVDIHDRHPVALNEQDANTWLDSQTPLELAAEIARHGSRAVNEFEWYEVSRELNNARHDSPELVKRNV
ncbi:SOS response-associated peptidase family protein [Robbsia andropogonis]|uniref:SOS response-associated peptidase family protein n=1 Tax=Robbsia andropogonis TaxID=28092 RepID=UPI002A69C23B|nr:SOS response-associated peptidase family protein [Robbsia andropogonis]